MSALINETNNCMKNITCKNEKKSYPKNKLIVSIEWNKTITDFQKVKLIDSLERNKIII